MEDYVSPVYGVRRVPIDKVRANEYNPNRVAPPEMRLLYDSIKQDGYTMPIVCYYNEKDDMYEIVDGFHRYTVMLQHQDIYDREHGMLPVSVIDKPIDERMASTIRHNRARGTHDVDLMSNIVAELHKIGRSDAWLAKHLGMDQDEILRLKQITGLAEAFKDHEFSRSWEPGIDKKGGLKMYFQVGGKMMPPSEEGMVFDMTDGGGILAIRMGSPTAAEKRAFKSGLSLRFTIAEDIIFITVRMGTLQWMDTPYYPFNSKNLTRLEEVKDGQGYGIHAMLIDSNTGTLVAQKLISTTTAGARALRAAILAQPRLPDYAQRLSFALSMHTTDELAMNGVSLC